MYKAIVFAGTAEGRRIAEYLNRNKIPVKVCVATGYGESLLPQGEYLDISHQRLGQEEMETLMRSMDNGLVIDATHPYAQIVTENIQAACRETGAAYLRVLREEIFGEEENSNSKAPVVYVNNTQEAVEYLEHTAGNILVTTGSKELAEYTALTNYRERIYARVLSIPGVVQSCAGLGVEGKHLICMQGPFSKEMNTAMIRQWDISWMVTKESGQTGGFPEKYLAARETECGLVIIGRPKKEEGCTLEECLNLLAERWKLPMDREDREDRNTQRKISLVGIGMGTADTLTAEGKRELEEADLLIGAGRMLEQIQRPGQTVVNAYKPEEICGYIKEHTEFHRAAVALSGDVGFYSGAKKLLALLKQELPQVQRKVCSGISSMIYFCGRLETPWEDVVPLSLHGRKRNLTGILRQNPRVFAIVGNRTGAAEVCRKLTSYGMGTAKIAVGERLSYPEEKISRGTAEEFQNYETDPLSVLLLEWEEGKQAVVTHGISDEEFLRDKVPMTKEEVRSISLSKLRLNRDSVIYDVGAGTGSVSVEMALQAVDGQVWAVEKKEEAVNLLYKNKQKFRADNLEIIRGLAPEACAELPTPTHAFIGGSSGNLREILELLLQKNPQIRVVINCITLETLGEAMECIRKLPVKDVDIAQVSVAKGKKAGPYHLMMGQNPVSIISFTGENNG
ncbi:MAG: precorrin-6A reductase [Clostridiales bacterium]|nr:precorrin-6A reductase [Clostridiales bacterium]